MKTQVKDRRWERELEGRGEAREYDRRRKEREPRRRNIADKPSRDVQWLEASDRETEHGTRARSEQGSSTGAQSTIGGQ